MYFLVYHYFETVLQGGCMFGINLIDKTLIMISSIRDRGIALYS